MRGRRVQGAQGRLETIRRWSHRIRSPVLGLRKGLGQPQNLKGLAAMRSGPVTHLGSVAASAFGLKPPMLVFKVLLGGGALWPWRALLKKEPSNERALVARKVRAHPNGRDARRGTDHDSRHACFAGPILVIGGGSPFVRGLLRAPCSRCHRHTSPQRPCTAQRIARLAQAATN